MPLPPELAEFLPEFQSEVRDYLRRLESGLLGTETEIYTSELPKQLLRAAHTIKGSSRMMGFLHVGTLAHEMENILTTIQKTEQPFTSEIVDVLLAGVDQIRVMIGQDPDLDPGIGPLVEQLKAVQANMAEKPVPAAPKASPPVRPVLTTPVIELDDQMRISASHLDELLRLMGELVLIGQQIELLQDDISGYSTRMRVFSQRFHGSDMANNSASIVEDHKMLYQSAEDLRRNLNGVARELTFTREALEHEVIALRLVPVVEIFSTLPRVVHDLARQAKKDVQLTIKGENTRLDRHILQSLNEPLVHIISNAIAHGFESSEERVAMGKPPLGHLTIEAYRCGAQVCIRISDDGRGIAPDKVRNAAIEKQLITPEDAAKLDDQAVLDLVYVSGISTASHLTEISGRGVGMDAVQASIRQLGGAVQLTSQVGHGTTITLELPVTLALIRVLLVQVAGQVYALPDSAVNTVLRLKKGQVIYHDNGCYLIRPDRLVLLDSLASLISGNAHKVEGQIAIIIRAGDQEIALVVDRILEERQVVVKSLGKLLGRSEVSLGATFLPDGSVVAILEPGVLIRLARTRLLSGAEPGTIPPPSAQFHRVLILDHALAGREPSEPLDISDYEVKFATDGEIALESLQSEQFSLFLINATASKHEDILALCQNIRQNENLDAMPIILASESASEAQMQAGIEAGVQAYLLEKDFSQTTLLNTILSLLS